LTWIAASPGAVSGAMPSLAEADAVIASSSAHPINAMRFIVVLPSHDCDTVYNFPILLLFHDDRIAARFIGIGFGCLAHACARVATIF
jgi:hypothetical protein